MCVCVSQYLTISKLIARGQLVIFNNDRVFSRTQLDHDRWRRLVVDDDAVRLRVAPRVVVREEKTALGRAALPVAIKLALAHVRVAVDYEPGLEAVRGAQITAGRVHCKENTREQYLACKQYCSKQYLASQIPSVHPLLVARQPGAV